MGRKPRAGDSPSRIRSLRMSDGEWQRITEAAERAGVSRSDWIRTALAKAAKRSERKARK